VPVFPLVERDGHRPPTYDPVAKSWSGSRVAMSAFDDLGSAEYDPRPRLIVFVSRAGLWTYGPPPGFVCNESATSRRICSASAGPASRGWLLS